MCGVIGVSNHPESARLAYLGLYALQHRGQESAGIVSVDEAGVARTHRGMGLFGHHPGELREGQRIGDQPHDRQEQGPRVEIGRQEAAPLPRAQVA